MRSGKSNRGGEANNKSRMFCFNLCAGLQHFVIEPPQPYGMPLNFTTLPQKLKEAGKIALLYPYYP